MNKLIKYILLLPFFIIFSCKGQTNPDCLVRLEEKLSPKVNEENKIGEIINIKDEVNCFDWDTLIVQQAMVDKKTTEKDLGIKIPFYYDDFLHDERVARLLFMKDNTVVHYIIQNPSVDKKTLDKANSIKGYAFVYLLNNYGKDGYAKIPKEKAIFETYPVIYHNKAEETKWALKYGLGIKVKQK
jgi:hypothetical protein